MLLSRRIYKVPGILRNSVPAPSPDQAGNMGRALCFFGCYSNVASSLEGRKAQDAGHFSFIL